MNLRNRSPTKNVDRKTGGAIRHTEIGERLVYGFDGSAFFDQRVLLAHVLEVHAIAFVASSRVGDLMQTLPSPD
jgi:hypothetical protein